MFMAQSRSENIVHIVFSTRHRAPTLVEALRPELYAVMAILAERQKSHAWVGGVKDHVHLAVRLHPTVAVSSFIGTLKGESAKWIKKQAGDRGFRDLSWQKGYGAFSIGRSGLPELTAYIDGQEEHHRVRTFKEEFRTFCEKYEVSLDERYVWE